MYRRLEGGWGGSRCRALAYGDGRGRRGPLARSSPRQGKRGRGRGLGQGRGPGQGGAAPPQPDRKCTNTAGKLLLARSQGVSPDPLPPPLPSSLLALPPFPPPLPPLPPPFPPSRLAHPQAHVLRRRLLPRCAGPAAAGPGRHVQEVQRRHRPHLARRRARTNTHADTHARTHAQGTHAHRQKTHRHTDAGISVTATATPSPPSSTARGGRRGGGVVD